ncbi:Protein transport protein S9 plasma membrane t-SNARE [Chytriomyces hyalinus]|nr:Protein transport protein S9 plasma membrane t-SNARE [Chytriomyces hyalinus]
MSYRNQGNSSAPASSNRSRSRDEYAPRSGTGKSFDGDRDRYNNAPPPRGVAQNGGGGGTNKWAAAASAAEEQSRNGGRPKYAGWENVHEEDENYDDEGYLARKTRATQNESRDTTRRALQKMYDAEEIGQKSLTQLNQQSEQLHRIEHRLDAADSHAKISEAKAGELKALNRWFFLPTFGASKKAAALEEKHKKEMAEAESRNEARKESARNGGGYYSGRQGASSESDLSRGGRGGGDARGARGVGDSGNGRNGYGGGGKSYSTPDGLERDDLEEEIDNNLDEMSAGLARLRMMGQTMGSEIESQTSHIRQISDRTDQVRDRVDKVHRDISKFSGDNKKRGARK